MVILFYVYDCLMFSPFTDKIDNIYAPLQTDFNIECDKELNNYPGILVGRRQYGSTHLSQPYLTQGITNLVPGMDKSSTKPTPAVKPRL